jgi:hypothetical protein
MTGTQKNEPVTASSACDNGSLRSPVASLTKGVRLATFYPLPINLWS